jgi:prepilin-type processing-associated H-X9-DG protein
MVILFSILFPALKLARDSAKNIQCRNNLKQIGIASIMYLQDNNEWFPACEGPTVLDFYHAKLSPYLNLSSNVVIYSSKCAETIWACPSFRFKEIRDYWGPAGCDYGPNLYAFGVGNVSFPYRRISSFSKASKTIMIAESFNAKRLYNNSGSVDNPLRFDHSENKTMNMLFLDGHTDSLIRTNDHSLTYGDLPSEINWTP